MELTVKEEVIDPKINELMDVTDDGYDGRDMNEILNEITPRKSSTTYEKRWEEFMKFSKGKTPSEETVIQFMDFLRQTKKYKSSSLWSWYSCLNSKYALMFGIRFQSMPRLTALMKSYNVGYERKTAKTFTSDQVYSFLALPLRTPFAILARAAFCIGICGGLRMQELHSLSIEDIIPVEGNSYKVTYKPAKQRGELKNNTFLIKKNQLEPSRCMYTFVKEYLDSLKWCNIVSGPLFRGCGDEKKPYKTQVMGKNFLAKIGKYAAAEVGLTEPERYTGHCLRRTTATMVADRGADVVDMMRHMNWRSTTTAMKYVDNSEARQNRMHSFIVGVNEEQTTKLDTVTTVKENVQIMKACTETESTSGEEVKKIINITVCGGASATFNL